MGIISRGKGKGRKTRKEYLQFLAIARGSLEEVKYLLLLAKDLRYVEGASYGEVADGYDQVGRMINGLDRDLSSLVRSQACPKPKTQHLKPKNHE